jgi:N,N'-diacetylbacillosaminyl-diphospho-undecaprenol alpha-1,3-N-acetylgalactosaminyltransferase
MMLPQVIQSIHLPVSARSFVLPMVKSLNQAGISTELWVENFAKQSAIVELLDVPKYFIASDLVKNPLTIMTRFLNYRRQLRRARPKVIHTHQTRAAIIPLLAAYLEQVPVRIYHNHGLSYLGYKGGMRWFLRILEVINISLSTHVLLVSKSNLAEARVDGILKQNQGYVLAHGSAVGIDLNEYKPEYFSPAAAKIARQKLEIPVDAFVLAYTGRPFKRKGFHLLIKAWERSGLGQQNHFLIIAGCSAAACDDVLGYPSQGVKGLGYLTSLREFYAACDAVTLPSEHEGFGYSLIEGAAAGKPLIGSDIPGIRCAIQPDLTGILIPKNNEIALAEAIKYIAFNPDLRHQLGKNARYRIEQEFTNEIVLAGLLDFYTNIIGLSADRY